jgi:hypothetical protein
LAFRDLWPTECKDMNAAAVAQGKYVVSITSVRSLLPKVSDDSGYIYMLRVIGRWASENSIDGRRRGDCNASHRGDQRKDE